MLHEPLSQCLPTHLIPRRGTVVDTVGKLTGNGSGPGSGFNLGGLDDVGQRLVAQGALAPGLCGEGVKKFM